jgi:hypothetical protein
MLARTLSELLEYVNVSACQRVRFQHRSFGLILAM